MWDLEDVCFSYVIFSVGVVEDGGVGLYFDKII